MSDPAILDRLRKDVMTPSTMVVSRVAVRFVAGLLAVAVAVAHVADRGGVMALAAPQWLGWSYRLIDVGGVVTALALAWRRSVLVSSWAGLEVGTGPFLALLRMSLDDRQPKVKRLEATERERGLSSAEIWSLWLPTGFK
jgi:hypothetical protein